MSPSSLGVLFKVASTLAFACMVTLVKLASDHVPPGEVLFARAFFGLIPVVVWLAWRGEFPSALRTARPWGHVRRAVVGTISMFCWFASLSYLPLADATALSYAGPLFGVVCAVLILGERVRIYRWTAVAIGFVGVLIILSEQIDVAAGLSGGRTVGAAFALVSAVFAALAMVTVRQLTATDTTGAIVFYFSAAAAAMSVVTVPFGWVVPTATEAVMLVSAGLFGGVGQVLLTQAYRYAEASVVAPFDYANMIWIVIIAFVVFGDIPTGPVILGSVIVIGSGVFVILRERRLGLIEARREARKANTPT